MAPFYDQQSDLSNFVISFTRDPKGDFAVFARAYAHAADRLAAQLLEALRFSDHEAYPVIFLYRHAFELSLKHIIYASALLAFSMVKVLAPGYFARQDTRTPVRIGIRSLAVSMGLNVLVVLPLAFVYPGRPGLHALLALNTGIGAWYNSTMLYRGLRRQGVLQHASGWRRMLWQVAAGNLLMVAFLW